MQSWKEPQAFYFPSHYLKYFHMPLALKFLQLSAFFYITSKVFFLSSEQAAVFKELIRQTRDFTASYRRHWFERHFEFIELGFCGYSLSSALFLFRKVLQFKVPTYPLGDKGVDMYQYYTYEGLVIMGPQKKETKKNHKIIFN